MDSSAPPPSAPGQADPGADPAALAVYAAAATHAAAAATHAAAAAAHALAALRAGGNGQATHPAVMIQSSVALRAGAPAVATGANGGVAVHPAPTASPAGIGPGGRPRRPFLGLLVASTGFVIVLDSFAANVAFPKIVAAFPATPRSTIAWVTTGYSIALAALLLVAGALGDRYGRRTVFLVGMASFATLGLASAAAPNPAFLITTRVLQGCAGALMVSTSIALGIAEYPAERRGLAMGWMGVMGSVASLIGPIVAGNIITLGGSWRWVFVAPAPIALVALAFGPRLLDPGRDPGANREPIDLMGVVLVVAASGLLTFAIQQTGQWGWIDGRTGGVVAVSVLLAAAFVVRCRRTRFPLLRLSLFSDRPYLVASLSQLGSQFSIFAFFFWTSLFLQNVWGWTPSTVGWIVALPLTISMSSMAVGRYADRRGYRAVLVIGGLLGAGANLWWVLTMSSQPRFAWALLPGLVLFGVSISLIGITSAAAALSQVHPADLATANSAFQTGRRLIQSLSVAVVIALLGNRSTDSVERFRLVWIVAGSGLALSSIVALWFPTRLDVSRSRSGR